ncbi:AAA family ATPase [Phaeobacter gallaeciensis]|uniref:ATPase n=2 Tax=Phaeobacter gallaeciensis TaxID=60890 RepID=A0AAD0EE39_9RHOB|nr:AAA family ATPase [Phaeobacter gallaeciensis]AHD10866.1 putative ATPase [Phaeobacter gallaeciensis DSM 26640]ATE94129.1 putative ATPase [Phaeobacter gallaeciensis]ATE96050.1 putative ATPase [Phaeobacter gallaeciensis]ATF02793.1 putative ATPase [Phaeobacter gallaeciensis]ATF07173.1 putative ATPase [Phaeobacter gallaeciensis]
MTADIKTRHVILSGCSGGGKSTLLTELSGRGFETVPEPGLRIVAQEMDSAGGALPWVNMEAFARCALQLARADRQRVATAKDWVFFDRGLVDAALALEHVCGLSVATTLDPAERYYDVVFLTPPWPEIYRQTAARRHSYAQALEEYTRLRSGYQTLGYDIVILPKTDVVARADFIVGRLGGT